MKINDKEIKLKLTYRAMMLWEQVMDKPFAIDGKMMSIVVLMWCIIEVNNPNTIKLDDFIDWLDEHPNEFNDLCNWYAAEQQKSAELINGDADGATEEGKKKQE